MTLEERILAKLDSIEARVGEQTVELAVYNQQLKEHMRRTALLEEEVKPIKEHVRQMQAGGRFIKFIAKVVVGLAGVAAAAAKIFGH